MGWEPKVDYGPTCGTLDIRDQQPLVSNCVPTLQRAVIQKSAAQFWCPLGFGSSFQHGVNTLIFYLNVITQNTDSNKLVSRLFLNSLPHFRNKHLCACLVDQSSTPLTCVNLLDVSLGYIDWSTALFQTLVIMAVICHMVRAVSETNCI